MRTWQSITSVLVLSGFSFVASAQTATETSQTMQPAPEQQANRAESVHYQSADILENYQIGPSFFVSARLGALQSFDLQLEGKTGRGNFEDTVTGSAAGLRVGLLLDKWRTWLEINPGFEASKDNTEIDVRSFLLATDYAVWQSDSGNQRFSVGAFASNLEIELREKDGSGLNQSVEAKGLSYGLQLGYRIDITDYLFAGVDLQYALNGVQGGGNDDINLAGIRVDDYMLGNFELGFKF